jgi:hypothetical protein
MYVPVVFMARYVNGFEAGKIHYEGHWKGWALEISTILAQLALEYRSITTASSRPKGFFRKNFSSFAGYLGDSL